MNIKRKSKGTPEQMLQAFENKINELEGNASIEGATEIGDVYDRYCVDCDAVTPQKYCGTNDVTHEDMFLCRYCGTENYYESEDTDSIESATNIDDSDDVAALWEALEDSYKGSEITPEVMYNKAKELFPDNYIAVLDESFSPNNYEWYDSAAANEWYNYMKETYDYEIPGLPFDDGSTDIQAANEVIDYKYLEKLCEHVTAELDDAGYDAVARVEGEYIVIESMYDVDSRYVQPIDDIEANWDDLNDDAAELADAYMDEYPDPDYDTEDEDDEDNEDIEDEDSSEYYDEPEVEY